MLASEFRSQVLSKGCVKIIRTQEAWGQECIWAPFQFPLFWLSIEVRVLSFAELPRPASIDIFDFLNGISFVSDIAEFIIARQRKIK